MKQFCLYTLLQFSLPSGYRSLAVGLRIPQLTDYTQHLAQMKSSSYKSNPARQMHSTEIFIQAS